MRSNDIARAFEGLGVDGSLKIIPSLCPASTSLSHLSFVVPPPLHCEAPIAVTSRFGTNALVLDPKKFREISPIVELFHSENAPGSLSSFRR